jgi:diguanylate cyclase (GGDEF)-like protein
VSRRADDDTARIQSLAVLARALGRSVRLDQMLELSSEEALKALKASTTSISALRPGTGALHTIINVGELAEHEERWPTDEIYQFDDYPQAQSLVSDLKVWVTRVDDPDADPGELALLHSLGKRSSMAAPLVVDGQLWGEFYASRGYDLEHFSPLDIAYTEALAAILSGALSRAIHFEALEHLAFRDPMTGLANRRALDDAATQVLARLSEGPGRRVTAVAVDVNGLKEVNDTAGHAAGDQLLTAVAGLLVRYFSPLVGSLVARVGGDEFTVLVPSHSVTAIITAADAFCLAAANLPAGAGVSCGVASTTGEDSWVTANRLFRAADQAQYEGKRRRSPTAILAAATG